MVNEKQKHSCVWYLISVIGTMLFSHLLMKYCIFDYQYSGLTTVVNITGSELIFTRSDHMTLIGKGGSNPVDLYKSLGWMHARDRYVQLCLMRLASQGRLTHVFPYTDMNHKVDLIVTKFNFHKISEENIEQYNPDSDGKSILTAYTEGINEYINNNKRPFEFMLLNYYPEPFSPTDITTFIRFVSYVGLDEICFTVEKLIIELIQTEKVSTNFLKEAFYPHLNNITAEFSDIYKSIKKVKSNSAVRSPFAPAITNSNNWVVSGELSSSGMPIMSSDPHLDVSKLPNTFYESSYQTNNGINVFGISVPGIPIILMGRTKDISFTFTYGMMDMGDIFVENIKNGSYERDRKFIPLKVRTHVVAGQTVKFYETEEGHTVERNTEDYGIDISDGLYQSLRIPNRGSDEETVFKQSLLPFAKTVQEAQELLPQSMLGVNYLLADVKGNIGYQQTGAVPLRPTSNGLLPLPAWNSSNLWTGYLSDNDYKRILNPPEKFIATANNVIQEPGKPCVNTYSALHTRVNRASELLRSSRNHTVEDMMRYQSDTFSTVANNTIPMLEQYLPRSGIGNELRHWDRRFEASSRPAALWHDFWEEFTKNVNSLLFGSDTFDRQASFVLNKYTFYKFVLHVLKAGHIDGRDIQPILKESITTSLTRYDNGVYGDVRRYFSHNMFFDGMLPRVFGMDVGPFPINGGFEALKVGVEEKYLDKPCLFLQTWRFVTDMSTNIFYSVLPGGPSGDYFSNIYAREIDIYLEDIYKKWEL